MQKNTNTIQNDIRFLNKINLIKNLIEFQIFKSEQVLKLENDLKSSNEEIQRLNDENIRNVKFYFKLFRHFC